MLGSSRQEATRKRITVIGLGRFGSSVARVSHELGYEVTAIDIAERRVADAANYATLAAQADGSDEEALLSLGRTAEARLAAQRLLASYPGTPNGARARAVLTKSP